MVRVDEDIERHHRVGCRRRPLLEDSQAAPVSELDLEVSRGVHRSAEHDEVRQPRAREGIGRSDIHTSGDGVCRDLAAEEREPGQVDGGAVAPDALGGGCRRRERAVRGIGKRSRRRADEGRRLERCEVNRLLVRLGDRDRRRPRRRQTRSVRRGARGAGEERVGRKHERGAPERGHTRHYGRKSRRKAGVAAERTNNPAAASTIEPPGARFP